MFQFLTGEIESINTLFQYDVRGHDFFQDPNFIPDFNPPTDVGIIDPDNLNRICAGNKLCEYDLQSTGNVELAKATMMAYNQHWLAHGASADREWPSIQFKSIFIFVKLLNRC